MSSAPPETAVLLVVPAFRESARLPLFLPYLCEAIEAAEGVPPVKILVVDDGSGDEETAAMRKLVDGWRNEHRTLLPMLALPENRGKGGAVYAGWDTAPTGCQWVAFVDADGAVPPAEVVRLFRDLGGNRGAEAVFALRLMDGSHHVQRTRSRKFIGQGFRRLVRMLFALPVPDTQCGFKIVPLAAYEKIRGDLQECRFCFDVELTALLNRAGVPILGVPIDWHESPGGKVRPTTIFEMLAALIRLKRRIG